MTWNEATDALLLHFATRWAALHADIPIHFPNAKPVSEDSETGAWLRLRFLPAFSQRVVVGGDTRIQGGTIIVNTFVPLDAGDGLSIEYDRDIESIWETAKANGLSALIHLFPWEGGTGIDRVPGMPDPVIPAYRSGVTVPFHFEHTP